MAFETTVGPTAAFLAGAASFLSPCVLPLVPGYVSYIAGRSLPGKEARDERIAWGAVWLALLFVLGFSTIFVALGASASALSETLLRYRREASIAGGGIVMLVGLAMLGASRRLIWFQRDVRFSPRIQGGRPVGAYVLGLAFGFGWTPCIGPVLGAILTLAAVSGRSDGIALLTLYSAGLGLPFLLAAAFTANMLRHQTAIRRLSRPVNVVAGTVMVLMGIAMISGQLTVFAIWLLRVFPSLGAIG
ncbi:cytochrome c biogenesis CcdA family protein [Piscinibacter koreensis]|uniref:Cytochrome c biogenesis protein CcdA n=1 Tax=Piscinibacter koreensis TaxID=2742824 RepID=A0A7Y6NSA4_9BURK|nr:cytochrome c biogenesis protein CcdA [Schlegelella koreensis]NUZ08396.1 cytochrome c biogenesis protein CcdA [Schlegelella koreensis]